MSKGKGWFWSQLGIIVNISNLFQCPRLHSWVIRNTALISKEPVKICFFYKKQLNPFTTKGILPASMIQGFILPKVISWLFLIINWELKKIPKGSSMSSNLLYINCKLDWAGGGCRQKLGKHKTSQFYRKNSLELHKTLKMRKSTKVSPEQFSTQNGHFQIKAFSLFRLP